MCIALLRFAAFWFGLLVVILQAVSTASKTQKGKPLVSTAARTPICTFYALGLSGFTVENGAVYFNLQVEHGQAVRGTKPHQIKFPSANQPDLFNKFVAEMIGGIYLFGPTTVKSTRDEREKTLLYKFVDSAAVCAFKLEDGCFDESFFGAKALDDFLFAKLVHYDGTKFFIQEVSRKELAAQKPYKCLTAT